MRDFLNELPSILVLGVLVGIFVSLQRRNGSARVRCWLVGWGLMFLHFLAGLLRVDARLLRMVTFVEIGTLSLAGIAFLVSVSGFLYRQALTLVLVLYFALPGLVYAGLLSFDATRRWPYALCLASFFYGGALWGLGRRRNVFVSAIMPLTVTAFGTWIIYRVLNGELNAGFYGMLLVSYAVTAMLFMRRYARSSPGVFVTVGGFLSWAGVWALALLAPRVLELVGGQNELWNVPKYLVAFGMIVVLLEEESSAAQKAGEREHAAGVQLQRFAMLTSHLLSGADVNSYCDTIAQTITEATTFERVVISVIDEDRCLRITGHAGLDAATLDAARKSAEGLSAAVAEEFLRKGRRIGELAVIVEARNVAPYTVRSTRAYEPNPHWRNGDELFVPLRSQRSGFVGLISLDDPRDPERVHAVEMSKIEMLAADLAVAIDNAAMQRQLVISEKLAGVGQLVSGVAHELNNPLTAVLGYAELLTERAADDDMRRGLGVIYREAQRIKGIVGNLLRFAQKDQGERKAVELLPVLQEILRHKAYEAHTRGIEWTENLASALPRVVADENQLKQVLLNVINNALDAVEKAPEKRVTVMARCEDSRVVLSFLDTGPGFADVNRIFDPFFTTKLPGKGTGLGLSICYGVVKQHGGSITARNISPTGACVTIELPAAKQQAAGTIG